MLSRARAAVIRVVELFRRRARVEDELADELSFHVEMETEENIRRGMSVADARRAALVRFGGTRRFREEASDARGVVALDTLVRDARFALRRLRRTPGFAIGVIATLGIGIGAAVGIGTIVVNVLLRDLPYPNPDRLVRVGFVTDGIDAPGDLQSGATYVHFALGTHSFTELGAYSTDDGFVITDGDVPERIAVALMTPGTFTLLGVHPLLGQLFEPRDTSWYGAGLLPILISERLWRRRYASAPSIIGRRIEINRGARVVIGVLPKTFAFPTASVDVFYPAPTSVRRPSISARSYNVVGRLRDGVSASGAETELNGLVPRLSEHFPEITPDMLRRSRARVEVQSLKAATVAPVRAQLVLLGMLVVVVLLIATTNVVNLFLLRTDRARQEIAIAQSLGASRFAVAQRFVVEGIVLGITSSLAAVPIAALALSTKFGFTEREIPRLHEVGFTAQTIALVLTAGVCIGTLVGAIGLMRADTGELVEQLRGSRTTPWRRWRRAQNGLVVLQIAIALMLMVAAGLLGRSFWNLRGADIGFDPADAMTFHASLPWGSTGYGSYSATVAFHTKVMNRLAELPGVTGVAAATRIPLASAERPNLSWQLRADNTGERREVAAAGNMVSPEYFHVMRIPIRSGRGFRTGDLRGTPAVVVSERLAEGLFGTTDVVGRYVRGSDRAGKPTFRIVGVVGDVQWNRIEDGDVPILYFPLLRDGDGFPPDSEPVPSAPRDVNYVVRGTVLPEAAAIEASVRGLDARVPATDVRTLSSLVDGAIARVRLTLLLIALAGGVALLLGIIGVYSVVSYGAAGRAREFAIRIALGAAPGRVRSMVLMEGLYIIVAGASSGLVGAWGSTRLLGSLLYEVQPNGAAEFGVATLVILAVTLSAILVPAHRAARTSLVAVLGRE